MRGYLMNILLTLYSAVNASLRGQAKASTCLFWKNSSMLFVSQYSVIYDFFPSSLTTTIATAELEPITENYVQSDEGK
jgi:hypothetical protein